MCYINTMKTNIMAKHILSTAAALLLLVSLGYADETELLKPSPAMVSMQESFSKLASTVKPTVVNISTVFEEKLPQYEFFFGSPFEEFFGTPKMPGQSQTQKAEAEGSGVIISAEGYILTNEHVVHGAQSIKVTLSDERKYTGKLVGRDERTDIAIIKINAGKDITFARLGDSDKIKVGEWVIAAGSPFGLEKTITTGIISAKRQSIEIEGKMYNNLIQTDAAINRGNSGGPLYNIYGEVIGINTAIYAPTGVFAGVGFAIPINNAKEILDSLIRKGKVVRGWLGVEIRPVDSAIASQFGLADKSGVLINSVFDNSPAKEAGLIRGDVIRAINGKTINTPDELQNIVTHIEPKTIIKLLIIRNKKEMTVSLTAGETPFEEKLAEMGRGAEPSERSSTQWAGMKVMTVNSELAQRYNITENEKGCVVIDVAPGSTAESIGIMQGDLIRSINQSLTPTVKEFTAATSKVKLSEGVVIDVDRQGTLLYLSFSEKQ